MRMDIVKPLAFALSLTLAPMAWAQDQGSSQESPDQAAQGDPVAGGLDMGEVVDGQREVGTTYVDEVFGDWERKCVQAPEGENPCQLYQLLKDANGTPTAEISLLRLAPGAQAVAGATVVVPLQTLLTQQLTISVDGGQTKRYPFRFCTQLGCFSQIGLTSAEVNAFKRGAKATLSIVPAGAPDSKVSLDMSLSGFTAGYDSLKPSVQ